MTNVLFGADLNALFSAGNAGKTGNFPQLLPEERGKKGKPSLDGFPFYLPPFSPWAGFTQNLLKKAKTGEEGQSAFCNALVAGGVYPVAVRPGGHVGVGYAG